ncbi:methyltransferase domain-containing protein [Ruegeria sp. SCPT10]|uniref:methyltransferase n=1 Tax=Ruegeria sp. SCP10 TaxID=3141377 RepID=UPI0033376BF4
MTPQTIEHVQRSFSRSFSSYHDEAGQQALIANRLVQDLCDNGAPRYFSSALELGCGTGLLTQRLRAKFDFGVLTLNDLSPEARHTAQMAKAAFLSGDAQRIEWPHKPDLIASSSMIQWLSNPAALMCKAADALAPGGWLAMSTFGPNQYNELVQIGSSARAPGLCTSTDLVTALSGKLEVVTTGETVQQIHFDSPRDVLKHLRNTGVNGRAQKTWTKSRLTQFTDDYIRLFPDPQGLPLTYHAVWIIARKCT